MSPNRPLSITIIGWMLLAFSVLGLVLIGYLLATSNLNREQVITLMVVVGFATLLQVPMGLGILNGANWARILFFWLTPTAIALGMVSGDFSPGLVFKTSYFVIFTFFLTRPEATAFFRKEKGKDRLAYGVVFLLIVLSILGTLRPKIMTWAEKNYRIGYVHHDIASLKLPADWKEGVSAGADQKQRLRISRFDDMLPTIAWGGLSAFNRDQLDISTGRRTTSNDSQAFVFQPRFLRDDRSLHPCGLARYRLTFPVSTKDPLQKILVSQLRFSRGAVIKHQYHWEADFRVLEYDVDVSGGYRFVVWSWWRKQDPNSVYGMIMGVPTKDTFGRNACDTFNIAKSLEIEREDGKIWKATALNTERNPAMQQVSGVRVALDLNQLHWMGVEVAGFFPWLKKQIDDKAHFTPNDVQDFSYMLANGKKFKLADVAKIYAIGKGVSGKKSPWHPLVVQINLRCPIRKTDREFIKSALSSGLTVDLNCRRR